MAEKKYPHSKEQSAEFLRQVLPLMSRHSAALHPISYALWYEYVAGINPALRNAVDSACVDGKTLDDAMVSELYAQYVAEPDHAKVQHISANVQKVLEAMSQSARETGEHANQYGSALQDWQHQLSAPAGAVGVANSGLQEILRNTGAMKESVNGLKSRLDESQTQIETLRVELQRAREEAMGDALTGLLNRKGLEKKLAEQFGGAAALPASLSVLMLDIDHFKRVNDSFGHLFGDKVIRAVAGVIKGNIKGQDIGVRYGGEEFLVLLPETPLDGALALAEKLRTLVASSRIKRQNSDEKLESVTISIGAAFRERDEALEALVERADTALYASKSNGRNRVTAAATAAPASAQAPARQISPLQTSCCA
jgi:diguanylate cyclase